MNEPARCDRCQSVTETPTPVVVTIEPVEDDLALWSARWQLCRGCTETLDSLLVAFKMGYFGQRIVTSATGQHMHRALNALMQSAHRHGQTVDADIPPASTSPDDWPMCDDASAGALEADAKEETTTT